jgi:hypothetical protein
MKLGKDLFPVNMNTVELDGKKVLVRPSQVESTKGKEVVIGEERHTRMIRLKNSEIGQWKKNERSKSRSHPKVTFNIPWLNTEMARPASGVAKTVPSGFPVSGKYFCARKLVQQPIQDTVTTKFKRSGSSSTGASFDTLLLDRATNVWAVGPFSDDVSALSTLGGVVRPMDSTTDAHLPGMIRTC